MVEIRKFYLKAIIYVHLYKGKLFSPGPGLFFAKTSFSLLLDTIDTFFQD